MIRAEDFIPVTYQNKHILDNYLRRHPQQHSEYSLVTILTWSHYAKCTYAIINNHLIIDCIVDGLHAYRAPVGEPDPDTLRDLITFIQEKPKERILEIYDEENRALFRTLYPDLVLTELRSYYEYCYKTTDLAALSGKKYINIRGQINAFNNRFTYTIEQITETNQTEILDLIEQWSREKHIETNPIMQEERKALLESLNHRTELNLCGIALRITEDNTIGALAIWEHATPDTATIHFEKGLGRYEGIYKIINLETARALSGTCTWINRESDMNIPGLRESKLRYHPAYLIRACYFNPAEHPKTTTI